MLLTSSDTKQTLRHEYTRLQLTFLALVPWELRGHKFVAGILQNISFYLINNISNGNMCSKEIPRGLMIMVTRKTLFLKYFKDHIFLGKLQELMMFTVPGFLIWQVV